MSDADAAVRARVEAYLRDRRAVEIEIDRLMEGRSDAEAITAFEEAKRRFAAFRASHVVPEAVCLMTSSPDPEIRPDGIEWLMVKVTGDRATARTLEPSWNPEEPDRYEYRLERRHGLWLLTDRRWHDPSTRAHWIKGLL